MSSAAEGPAGLRVGRLEVAGSPWRVAWRTAAPGDARLPLVLCNGIGVNWELFVPLVQALGSRAVVAFDTPGTGDSPPLPRPYSLPRLADHVTELLGQLGITRFDLLGVSWGGTLAQQVALQFPQACRRLVLAATSTGWASVPGKLSALWQLSNGRRFADPQRAAQVLPEVYGGSLRNNPAALQAYLRQLKRPSREGYEQQMMAIAGWTSLWWLRCLPQRTLILAGRDDPLVPVANARLMHGLLRASELEIVNDGHLFLHTRANEVAPRIAAFLDT